MNYYMGYLKNIFATYSFEIVFVLVIVSIILLIFNAINRAKIALMAKKYKDLSRLLQLEKSESLEDTLITYLQELGAVKDGVRNLEFRYREMNDKLKVSIQKVGFIRYNAFNDMGSDLSFSIALLDENSNGFVITNIYAKDESNVYAKPIVDGKSTYPLSVEEMQALDRAMSLPGEVTA
ncbi:hypothetical protein Curi_c28960 [Gottschalkia acidurici 9a]|uniref:DUF4446 domain-containing protein n=1 Tax=Gottschalkia acidurici (strain ATCC 7906 / DSM 604 / BCRC 14475 / CIP 104303 / KCTC 5404 / NCIMB 10678 / 9a) TaxID=1128398 RepID=K0B417_GOTA9|nr:DUF4446 family protein [Gottschalkia acidurici]AFS79862.1 hypothetical protein Curi_c28960 [Gottschalkia acidurici 9a]